MATSRKPPARATSAAQYRASQGKTVELPSGNHAVLRRVGMDKFLSAGYMPDNLREVITKEIGRASRKPVSMDSLQGNMKPEEIVEWLATMDRLVATVFVEPQVRWHMREKPTQDQNRVTADYEEIPEEERDPAFLYTDELDMEDKQFAFRYATGGSTDLTRFRAEAASLVAGVPAGEDMALSPEPSAVPER